jgi:hypothetical protein
MPSMSTTTTTTAAAVEVIFVTNEDTWTNDYDQYLLSLGVEIEEPYVGCECEQDWNCGLHASRVGTWIETRYAGLDNDEAIAYGRFEDVI